MRKGFLVIGIVLLIGGVILLWMSGIRETKFVARSINDDELRAYLEEGEYQVHASHFFPEEPTPKIKVYDPYDNLIYESILIYEKNYESKFDFTVHTEGIHEIKIKDVEDDNGILELKEILHPFKNYAFIGIPLIALGIASTLAGIMFKPYREHRSGETK